jgi:hypothetical protein
MCLTLYFPDDFPDNNWADESYRLSPDLSLSGEPLTTEWSIGRAPTNKISIGIKTVSRFHAVLTFFPTSKVWAIIDLGSTAGTYVGPNKINPNDPFPIKVGDSLWLGGCRIYVTQDEGDTLETLRDNTERQEAREEPEVPSVPPPPLPAPSIDPIGPWDIFPMVWEWYRALPLYAEFVILMIFSCLAALWIWRCR